jgi:hypothetical protein
MHFLRSLTGKTARPAKDSRLTEVRVGPSYAVEVPENHAEITPDFTP